MEELTPDLNSRYIEGYFGFVETLPILKRRNTLTGGGFSPSLLHPRYDIHQQGLIC
jgi:hypothetical protein